MNRHSLLAFLLLGLAVGILGGSSQARGSIITCGLAGIEADDDSIAAAESPGDCPPVSLTASRAGMQAPAESDPSGSGAGPPLAGEGVSVLTPAPSSKTRIPPDPIPPDGFHLRLLRPS